MKRLSFLASTGRLSAAALALPGAAAASPATVAEMLARKAVDK